MENPPAVPPPLHLAEHAHFLAFREHQRKKDTEHLKLLEIFHYILGGFALLGIGFIAMHYLFMSQIFNNPRMFEPPIGPPVSTGPGPITAPPLPHPGFPKEIMEFMRWIYAGIGSLFLIMAVANVLSAIFIRRREYRAFSLVIAGVNCLQMPFGTLLGVFTIMVLLRESVREAYEATPH